ncbi:hypothetical protein D3C85_889140 [compost metagenome]
MLCFGWVDLPYLTGEFDEISFTLGSHTFGSDHGIKGRQQTALRFLEVAPAGTDRLRKDRVRHVPWMYLVDRWPCVCEMLMELIILSGVAASGRKRITQTGCDRRWRSIEVNF